LPLAFAGVVVCVVSLVSAQAWAGTAGTVAASGGGGYAAISANGRFVAFDSTHSNLIAGDTNHLRDVFVRDLLTGRTQRVSVSSGGKQANAESDANGISADGRFVVFESSAWNLVPHPSDSNGWQVFVRDRLKGTTKQVSVSSSGKRANDWSTDASPSANGRFVAFDSVASNLVPETIGAREVYVRDLQTETTELVSVSSAGKPGNNTSWCDGISADGRFVVFSSWASNLVPGDTNHQMDVFVRDRLLATTERVSVGSGGQQASGQSDYGVISDDGRFVVFSSNAPNLVPGDTNNSWNVFVHDNSTDTTELVSVGSDGTETTGGSHSSAISADGRFVAFDSTASNLVPGDTNGKRDVFVRDLQTGTTERVSVSSDGKQANNRSFLQAMSPDGRFVVFDSYASNLAPGDTHGKRNVFVRDLQTGTTKLVSAPARR
jgi:hypothetical protein